MSLGTFIHSDWATKKQKMFKWWHRNDWVKAHTPSLMTRIKTEWYYLRHKDDCVVVDGWLLKFYETENIYMNWGDDINVYLFELLTKKKVVPANKLLFRTIHPKFCLIGSVLPVDMNMFTTVWGSGCLDFEKDVMWYNHPRTYGVKAVRGPLTRNYLLKHGIDCPEIYGDPALLLPMIYQPSDKHKKYPITIIPHHKDWDNKEELLAYISEYFSDVHIINMCNYVHWTDVIDEIVQSDVVFSSSLHGLIVSDAYGVPNKFAEFVYHHPKYDKFEDYYLSLTKLTTRTHKKTNTQPLLGKDISRYIKELKNSYTSLQFNLQPLIRACPFEIDLNN